MKPRILALLREEQGQSLVLFVVSFMALMSILALLVNLGSWLQSKERIRIVADATALEAAQLDHDTFGEVSFEAPNAAQARAEQNWAGSALTGYIYRPDGDGHSFRAPDKPWLSIEIRTQHAVGYLLEGLLDYLGIPVDPMTFSAQARVQIDSPEGLPQVAPIALKCPRTPCSPPFPGWTSSLFTTDRDWPLDPADTSPTSPDARSFEYKPDPAHTDDTFLPVEPFPGATVFDVESTLASCDARQPTNPCGMDVTSTPATLQPLDPGPGLTPPEKADNLRAALQNAGEWPHLVPVYDNNPDTDGFMNVIGFAAFTFEVDAGPGGPVTITGTFHKMFYDNARLLSTGHAPEGGEYDFGVRTIAYTGPRVTNP
jgi:hypothetical protein